MSALLGTILQACRFWLRGWWAIGALLHHPARSVRLASSLGTLTRDATRLLVQMAESGVTVETPEPKQAPSPPPVLRTRLTGFGDVMTFVESRSLTDDLADLHLARVRSKLRPLRDLGSSLVRAQALLTATIALATTAYSALAERLGSIIERAVFGVLFSLAVTLLGSLVLQALSAAVMRRVRAQLGMR